MRLLLINEECGTGSTGRICTDIAAECENRGIDVKIAFGRNSKFIPDQFRKYALRVGNNFDLVAHCIRARLFDDAGFGSKRATKNFINTVNDFSPDVIHLHNVHGYYINVELLFEYLKSCKKKILWTLHDVWAFTGHSAYCDVAQCTKWKSGCGSCPLLSIYPKSYVDRSRRNWKHKREIFTSVPNLKIITPSNWLAGLVKESFLKDYPVEVINNGIDTTLFKQGKSDFKNKNNLEGKTLLLGVAAVWNDLKGLSDFIRLAGLLDDSYRIVLVGGINEDIRSKLPHNIIHIRKTYDIHEMVGIYNAADIFVNLTYCDTYPLVNLESTACGLPVLSYEVGGSTESALMSGGVVVPRGNVTDVLKAIRNIDYGKRRCNVRIKDKHHTVEEYLRRYLDEDCI